VVEIAKMQYQNPAKILEYTAQISELNLVYIHSSKLSKLYNR